MQSLLRSWWLKYSVFLDNSLFLQDVHRFWDLLDRHLKTRRTRWIRYWKSLATSPICWFLNSNWADEEVGIIVADSLLDSFQIWSDTQFSFLLLDTVEELFQGIYLLFRWNPVWALKRINNLRVFFLQIRASITLLTLVILHDVNRPTIQMHDLRI